MRLQQSFFVTFDIVSRFIERLISSYPKGMLTLLGLTPPPDIDEIFAVSEFYREKLPEDFKAVTKKPISEAERRIFALDEFNEVVAIMGGWKHITAVSSEFRLASPRYWAIVFDHVIYVETKHEKFGTLNFVANKHDVSPNTVMKYRREFPDRLAEIILMTPPL